MDRKSIVILVLCFALILLWPMLSSQIMHKLYPNYHPPVTPTNVVASPGNPGSATGNSTSVPATTLSNSNTYSQIGAGAGAKFVVRTEIPEELVTITNNNARYIFTSRGGGLKEVQLVHYAETVSSLRHKRNATNDLASLNAPTAPPVFALLGDDSLQGDGVYKLTPTPGGMRAEKQLPSGVTVVKDFQLEGEYLVNVSLRYENRSAQNVALPLYQVAAGVSTPMNAQDTGLAQTVLWYNGSKAASVGTPYFNTNTTAFFGFFPRTPLTEYLAGTNNVNWVSAQNQFFVLAAMPKTPAEAVVVRMIDLPEPTAEDLKDNPGAYRAPKGLQASLIYPGRTLLPGQSLTNQFILFAGPKEYQTLAALGAKFNNDIDLVMNFGWVSPVSKILLVVMNWLHHAISLPYGLTIIFITVFIKAVFWPLTAASVRSAKRMQVLQPQLKQMQEKYKDDPQKLTQKQWEFYKKNKVNPVSGCLPMLLQVPVFIGFYGMLRTAIELRGAQFLWMGDLSKPDTVLSLVLPLHSLGMMDSYWPINPMPLIMGATLLWQASMTPLSPGMDPSQQKIMKYMPLIMLFFMYSQPSGLALYWTVNNLLTILQTKLTKTQTATVATAEAAKPALAVAPPKKKK